MTYRDVDGPPRVRVAPVSGNERSGSVEVGLSLDRRASVPVRMRVGLESGTATVGPSGDVPVFDRTIEVSAGSQGTRFRVPVRTDTELEPVERFGIVFSDWENARNANDLVVVADLYDGGLAAGEALFEKVDLADLGPERRAELRAGEETARASLARRLAASRTAPEGPDDPFGHTGGIGRNQDAARQAGDVLGSVLDPAGDRESGAGGTVASGAPARPYVLLGSFRALENAQAERGRLLRLVPGALADLRVEVRWLQVSGTGRRLAAVTATGFADAGAARRLCDRVEARGAACLARP
jgi:hypothetical protein